MITAVKIPDAGKPASLWGIGAPLWGIIGVLAGVGISAAFDGKLYGANTSLGAAAGLGFGSSVTAFLERKEKKGAIVWAIVGVIASVWMLAVWFIARK